MNKKTSNPPSQGYSTSEEGIDYTRHEKTPTANVRFLSALEMTPLMSICAMACNIEEFTELFPFLAQKHYTIDRFW